MDSDDSSSRSSSPEEEEPGSFPFPYGKHSGKPIRDVPQDHVWWALRPDNRYSLWYNGMYEDNKRLLDNKYKSCSPGSEPIWFGKAYRGHRLDMVYRRKRFMNWCFSPKRNKSGWIYRLEDLIRRLWEWRRAHPNRHGPRKQRKTPTIENPTGEAIGPWNDSAGSAAEDDDYERDGFVVSDSDEGELDDEDEPGDEVDADNEDGLDGEVGSWDEDESSGEDASSGEEESNRENAVDGNNNPSNEVDSPGGGRDPDESTSSDEETTPVRCADKRKRRNLVLSDDSKSDEENHEDALSSARELGRKYRVEDSEEEVQSTAKKAPKRLRR